MFFVAPELQYYGVDVNSLEPKDLPDVIDTLIEYHMTVLPNQELQQFVSGITQTLNYLSRF